MCGSLMIASVVMEFLEIPQDAAFGERCRRHEDSRALRRMSAARLAAGLSAVPAVMEDGAGPGGEPLGFEQHRLSLRFKDSFIEEAFQNHHFEVMRPRVRLLAVSIWLLTAACTAAIFASSRLRLFASRFARAASLAWSPASPCFRTAARRSSPGS